MPKALIPAAKSEQVAEQVTLCLQAVFNACSCSADDVLPIIERLCPLLELPAENMSEEVPYFLQRQTLLPVWGLA